jgi:hypothetical protein
MIGITTQIYRGFAIHIECIRAACPPCRATIRLRFQELRPRPGILTGATEDDVIAQAKAVIDHILAGNLP